jgi:hypothetical protein
MTIGKGKRPRDPVQLAKQVFDISIGDRWPTPTCRNPASAVKWRFSPFSAQKSAPD